MDKALLLWEHDIVRKVSGGMNKKIVQTESMEPGCEHVELDIFIYSTIL